MDKNKKVQIKSEIEKFVVGREDDMLDIVGKITTSDAQKIILTFTEPSDILISPINIKVLLETADEQSKAIIAQIVQNSVGVRNAKEAGITVTEATGTILDEYWNEAEKGMRSRTKHKEEKLQGSNLRYRSVVKEDEETVDEEVVTEEVEETREDEKSDFQKRVEGALERARISMNSKEGKVVQEGGLTLALDQDIEVANKETMKNSKSSNRPSLIGRDIAFMKNLPEETVSDDSGLDDSPKPVKVNSINSGTPPLVGFFKTLGEKISSATAKKIAIRIIAPLLIVLIASLWLVYTLAPSVRVTMYVNSKEVSVEKVFNGDLKANEFNYESGIVPIKKEEASKSVSGTATATGKAFRGNKSEGVVTLKWWGAVSDLPVTVASGTVLTANTGEKFELLNDVIVGDGGSFLKENVAVRAVDVGEEYNLSGGKTFSVAGYDQSTEMSAENGSAFAGGSKEQYTILTQGDVDKIVKEIKPTTINEVEVELEDKNGDGWEIIPSTIKADSEGTPKTDTPVGAEADIANVTIEVKGVAMYFKKGELENKMDEVLTKSAHDQNLFEGKEDLDLELDNSIEKEITVEEAKGDVIKIKIVAKGSVKPKIDKNEIVNKLGGLDWKKGNDLLKSMKYTDREAKVTFTPDYFPEGLWYFPSRQGKIILTIEEVFN